MTEKDYHFEVKIISDCLISANSEKEAKEIIKSNWKEENNIDLEDNEITLLAVVKEKTNKDGTKDITID